MTRRIGRALILESEPPKTCTVCGLVREVRPYGKGGTSICFDCAMSTPEDKAEAERRLSARLDGREPGSES